MGYVGRKGGRGIFEYVCESCGEVQRRRMQEFARKCRPRCVACGSVELEPKTRTARDRHATGEAAAAEYRQRGKGRPC